MDNTSNNLPHLPTGEEIDAKPEIFLEGDNWIETTLADELLDVTKDYPIEYTMTINGTPFAPRGGIVGMTGQPGHGKTMTLAMIAAAVLGDTEHGLEWQLKDQVPNPRVMYIDTEMERGNTMLVNKRICAMLGRDGHTRYDDLTILCLREVTTAEERWRKVLKAIFMYEPTVVILDGLIDVVADFNDNVNCQELIFKCMATASHYNISLWLLLHQNPGTEKMVGHSGSFLERKASDILQTKKVKDKDTGKIHFEVSSKKSRSKDWEDYKFLVDDYPPYYFGLPKLMEDSSIAPEPEEEDDNGFDVYNMTAEMLAPMQMLITDRNGMTTRDMEKATKDLFKIGATKADKAMEKAVEFGILIRAENKRYYLPDPTGDEGQSPF